MKISARKYRGTVSKVTKGAVNSELNLTLTGGDKIAAIITNESVDTLGLKEGKKPVPSSRPAGDSGKNLDPKKISTRNVLRQR